MRLGGEEVDHSGRQSGEHRRHQEQPDKGAVREEAFDAGLVEDVTDFDVDRWRQSFDPSDGVREDVDASAATPAVVVKMNERIALPAAEVDHDVVRRHRRKLRRRHRRRPQHPHLRKSEDGPKQIIETVHSPKKKTNRESFRHRLGDTNGATACCVPKGMSSLSANGSASRSSDILLWFRNNRLRLPE